MKFVPKLCITVVLLLPALLLPACSSPARVADATVAIGEGSIPKSTQTTWATPEPTPTESAKSNVGPSDSMLDECEKLDKVIAYRFQKSGVKCAQVLELRAQFVQEVGEQKADWMLLAYHSENCTEKSGQNHSKDLRYDPSKKTHGEELLYIVKPGESDTPTGTLGKGEQYKFTPCIFNK